MTPSRRIYLAAPLSAPTHAGIEANRRSAARWVVDSLEQALAIPGVRVGFRRDCK